ncbi:MAG TPA: alpha/beta hydrolase [Thermoanaerobaculia bacterium]|jgi:pimeloyl-ACP methyl ester carboxylesterase|nr:alpha/beta hydrolase [Thermoanaerobaculia bacterium]
MTPPKISVTKRPLRHLRASDLRALAQLAAEGTEGVTDIVEGVHRSVWSTLGAPVGEAGRTRGITGFVFRSIRGITRSVGRGVDHGFAWLHPRSAASDEVKPSTPEREAALAALNGVMGDRLASSGNSLATPMTIRFRGTPLDGQAPPPTTEVTGKVLALIHGLCMNDLQWRTRHAGQVVDHGETLAAELGYTPVYVRYNSGRHISENGRELSAQLAQLVANWPVPVEDLTVLAHSMGGLLTRSACHYARQDSSPWLGHLKNIVFLATPHHGAPLERAGNWVDVLLAASPYAAPFAKLGQLRSAGITDLRYSNLLDEDWQGQDRFERKADNRQIVPLPEGVACYAIAATSAAGQEAVSNRVIGDGLVLVESALGQHEDPRRRLEFPEANRWIGFRMNHLELLSRVEVGRVVVGWLGITQD